MTFVYSFLLLYYSWSFTLRWSIIILPSLATYHSSLCSFPSLFYCLSSLTPLFAVSFTVFFRYSTFRTLPLPPLLCCTSFLKLLSSPFPPLLRLSLSFFLEVFMFLSYVLFRLFLPPLHLLFPLPLPPLVYYLLFSLFFLFLQFIKNQITYLLFLLHPRDIIRLLLFILDTLFF